MLNYVTIHRLKDYLINKNWIEEPFGRDTVLKFTSPEGNEYYNVLIPAKSELVDYNRVVEVAIYGIAAVEGRDFYDVLSDILPCVMVELIEIRHLISECELLISTHRDDFALKQSTKTLKVREQNLVDELNEASDSKPPTPQ